MSEELPGNRWLLLIHQIPPKPAYLRVKVARRLHSIGAVAIKNTVYVLPATDATIEDFQWTVREITEAGGEATVCEASFIEGRSDSEVETLFNEARSPDYDEILENARRLLEELRGPEAATDARRRGEQELVRIEKRLRDVQAIDFFAAPGSEAAASLVADLRRSVFGSQDEPAGERPIQPLSAYHGRTWVTRKGIHVDRMASAWLIRRSIDAAAKFKFVTAKGYRPEPGELRFDMFEAEFTHEGDQCTFEVLLARAQIDDPALRALAEVIHDIDLKDGKFRRPETEGVAAAVAGICFSRRDDVERLERGSALFEDLYAYYDKKRR